METGVVDWNSTWEPHAGALPGRPAGRRGTSLGWRGRLCLLSAAACARSILDEW